MPDDVDFEKLDKIRSAFGQMKDEDEKIMLLQAEAFEKYGQTGEDIAVDILTDYPELVLSEDEFWQRVKAELED